jgi:hypothetical protein
VRATLGHSEVGRNGDPDDDERGQDPEQERGLTDRQPGQLLALEEEADPMCATAMKVELDDFAAHGLGGVASRPSFAVAIEDRPAGPARASHRPSVALSTFPARAGSEKSYGTYFGEKDVLVVRFVGPRKAKTVLHARHEGEVTRCR